MIKNNVKITFEQVARNAKISLHEVQSIFAASQSLKRLIMLEKGSYPQFIVGIDLEKLAEKDHEKYQQIYRAICRPIAAEVLKELASSPPMLKYA